MRATHSFGEIYLYKPFVDMRKSINGLSQIVEENFKLNPCEGGLFVFISRDRTILKCLYWDRTGFALWHKRLEKAKFRWLKKATGDILIVTPEKLDWLLAGLDIEAASPHEELHFQAFS
jgi:transposase